MRIPSLSPHGLRSRASALLPTTLLATTLAGLLPAATPERAAAAVPVSARAASPAAAPSQTAAAAGAYTVFNRPAPGAPDYTIENHLVRLVDGAPAGSVIRGAMYSWTRTPVADALRRARQRGVTVRLAVDRTGADGSNADARNPAIAALKSARLDRLVLCGNRRLGNSACIGNRANSINHNKFFTFSATGGMKSVVFVSSYNLTYTQARNFNNAVVVHGDDALHRAFREHSDNLLAQRRNNNYHQTADGYFSAAGSSVRAYFSPRADSRGGTSAEASTDIVAKRLTYLKRREAGCAVDVAHAQFTGPRTPVADQLVRIARLGCRVRVVGGMTDHIRDRLKGTPNLSVRRLSGMHSKYLVLTGDYDGESGRSLVFTGSHNLTGPALRAHDETMIRLENKAVAAAYRDDFRLLWSRAGSA